MLNIHFILYSYAPLTKKEKAASVCYNRNPVMLPGGLKLFQCMCEP